MTRPAATRRSVRGEPSRNDLHDDLGHDLRAVIAGVDAADPHARFRAAAWHALAADPVNLTRNGAPAHFTASALPVDPAAGRACLVLHRRINQWVQPGGHLEAGDATMAGAAAREVWEETGLAGQLDPQPLLLSRHRSPCGTGDWHLDVQLLVRVTEVTPTVSDESHDVAFFDLDDLPGNTASGIGELVAAARRRLARHAPRHP